MNSRGMKTCICDNPRDIYNFVIEYMRSFILQKHAYERCNYLDELDPDRTAELSKGNWHQAQHTSRSTHDATDSAATREQNAKRLPTHGYQKISNIYFGAKLSDIWTQRKKGMPAIHKENS
jgi:hypothetical protein